MTYFQRKRYGLALCLLPWVITAPSSFAALVPLSNVKQIDSGGDFTCAVTNVGEVKCWGNNNNGGHKPLGETNLPNRTTVITLPNVNGIKAIAGSDHYTCMITTSDGVKCLGRNVGFLSNQTPPLSSTYSTPTDIAGLSNITAIAAGGTHVCVLNNVGGVSCWGSSYQQKSSSGSSSVTLSTPTPVGGLESGVTAITAGEGHTCALLSTGKVKCWGYNTYGQVGDGTSGASSAKYGPVEISSLSNIAYISAGLWHTCAITNTGGVKCWGRGDFYQLGNGKNVNTSSPTDVTGLSSGAVALAAGFNHTCALMNTGKVQCWGSNFAGQVVDTDVATWNSSKPVEVTSLTGKVTALTAITGRNALDTSTTCALMETGQVKCWGAYFTVIPLSSSSRNIVGHQPVTVTTEIPCSTPNALGVNAQGQPIASTACFQNLIQTPQGIQANYSHLIPPADISGNIRLSVAVTPDPVHVGQPAESFVIAYIPTLVPVGLYMKSGPESWLLWDSNITSLVAAGNKFSQLPASFEEVIFDGVFTNDLLGNYTIFVGYRLLKNGMLIYNGLEPMSFFVTR
ncbi:MAG: hypothetical protein BWK79_16045 [Beggiatoa sp. IS2]|nr:MAG: hypothetical protein BWK79_16045 [Beggiatoa sp. IS2]